MSHASAWFPCYPNDLLGSIRWKRMTAAQRGAYWQLICWQMQSDDGHFDDDVSLLSALADLDLTNGNAIVAEAFPVQENGRRANGRALAEWAKRRAISNVRSKIGKDAIHKRWQGHTKPIAIGIPIGTTTTTTTTIPHPHPQPEGDICKSGDLPTDKAPASGHKKEPKPKTFKQWTAAEFEAEVERCMEGVLDPHEARRFLDYWSETSASGRMKFSLQQTWETKRRMFTWRDNNLRRS